MSSACRDGESDHPCRGNQSNNAPGLMPNGLASFSITVAVGLRRPLSMSLT